MNRNSKCAYIYFLIIGILVTIIVYYTGKSYSNRKKEESAKICRASSIDANLLFLLSEDNAGNIKFANNSRFARAAYRDALYSEDITQRVEIYYEMITICNASCIIGTFEYRYKERKHKIYIGIDYLSKEITILDKSGCLYHPLPFTYAWDLRLDNLSAYILSRKWRQQEFEIQNRESSASIWMNSAGVYSIRFLGSSDTHMDGWF